MKNMLLTGMRSAINLFPQERRTSVSLPAHSDEEAFEKDLRQVGSDMYLAIKTIAEQNNNKKTMQSIKIINTSRQEK